MRVEVLWAVAVEPTGPRTAIAGGIRLIFFAFASYTHPLSNLLFTILVVLTSATLLPARLDIILL